MFERDELKRVSDVLGTTGDFGVCLRPDEVAGRDVIILGYELYSTRFGPAAKVYIDDGGRECAVLTWSSVVIDKLGKLDGLFPIIGKFVKVKRYWTIE
jgi:hypothetical protein